MIITTTFAHSVAFALLTSKTFGCFGRLWFTVQMFGLHDDKILFRRESVIQWKHQWKFFLCTISKTTNTFKKSKIDERIEQM